MREKGAVRKGKVEREQRLVLGAGRDSRSGREGRGARKEEEGGQGRLSGNAPGSSEFTFQVGKAGIVFGA